MRTRIYIRTDDELQDQGLITDPDIFGVEGQSVLWTKQVGHGEIKTDYVIESIRFAMTQVGQNISVEKQIILF